MKEISASDVVKNALSFAQRRKSEKEQDKQARSLVKPGLIDKALLYIQAVV